MKHTIRNFLCAALVLFGTSAFPFEDGFEAQASTCWSGVEKVDALNDTQGAVLVSPGSMVCLDGATAKFNCQPDSLGICKRETPTTPPPVTPPPSACPPLPHTYTGVYVPWADLFYGATFPAGPSHLSPIGSFTHRQQDRTNRGPSMARRYLYTEFVQPANKTFGLSWLQAQPVSSAGQNRDWPYGYGSARTGVPIVTISECKGDLRPQNQWSTDPEIKHCRGALTSGNLSYGNGMVGGKYPACRLTAGKTYRINIAFIDTTLGYPDTTTCRAGDNGRCEANFNAR